MLSNTGNTHTIGSLRRIGSASILLAAALIPLGGSILQGPEVRQLRRGSPKQACFEASCIANASATVSNTAVVTAAAVTGTAQNASHNASSNMYPFSARARPAVGKVFALYYSRFSDAQATSVEATGTYKPARRPKYIWQNGYILPKPTCSLQLTTHSDHSSKRLASLRLAELAVCELYGSALPSCGATGEQVCELKLFAPLPSSSDGEPAIAAAYALVAYSQLCAMSQNSKYNHYKCQIQRSMKAVCAGLKLVNGHVKLQKLGSPGLLDLKLHDAYMLRFQQVTLAADSNNQYHKTKDYEQRSDVLAWSHSPPKIDFCEDLACLVKKFIR